MLQNSLTFPSYWKCQVFSNQYVMCLYRNTIAYLLFGANWYSSYSHVSCPLSDLFPCPLCRWNHDRISWGRSRWRSVHLLDMLHMLLSLHWLWEEEASEAQCHPYNPDSLCALTYRAHYQPDNCTTGPTPTLPTSARWDLTSHLGPSWRHPPPRTCLPFYCWWPWALASSIHSRMHCSRRYPSCWLPSSAATSH